MLHSRKIGPAELFQITEFTGPTHDADWMLPGLTRGALDANASWLSPGYWLPHTNRLVFTMQLFVLRMSDRIIVIDTGVGNHKTRRASSQNMLNTPMADWLNGIGAEPEKVTHVAQTHLHGDHVGWNTHFVDGRWEPFFPNATYYFPKTDFAVFQSRYDAGDRDLYGAPFADSVLPVLDTNTIRFVEDGDEIADCLTAGAAPGHTEGQLTYGLRVGDGREYVFAADVFHSPIQVMYPDINSRWCELQDAARKTRHALLHHAAKTSPILFPAHAQGLDGWQITHEKGGYSVRLDESF
jgi:glyoxylase-like metal-dependent hydrolase (beta-lactamase superfamily II)